MLLSLLVVTTLSIKVIIARLMIHSMFTMLSKRIQKQNKNFGFMKVMIPMTLNWLSIQDS